MSTFEDARALVAQHIVSGAPRSITPDEVRATLDKILDALAERATNAALVDALGNDPNFAATMASALAGKQPTDADLSAIAALATTTWGRDLLTLADAAALRTLAGLVIGTNVQAFNARLADIAGASWAQGDIAYYNGANLVRLAAGTNGHYLKTLGVGANPAWTAPSSGGVLLAVTPFTASGTWTPNASTARARLIVQAAGGGGGGADGGGGTGAGGAGGGGAGGYVERWLTAGWGASQTITIGAAGAAGAASGGGTGGAGGDSSVGTLAVANGGVGGAGSTTPQTADTRGQNGGNGGAASVAGGTSSLDLTLAGAAGFAGIVFGSSTTAISGQGAASRFGPGGKHAFENAAGSAGTSYGSGGSGGAVGASTTDRAGGAGAPGIVIIEEYAA